MSRCVELVACPRCSGCGYDDCADCRPEIEAKRPGCWKCSGTGKVQCEIEPAPHPSCPHATRIPTNGETCPHCDKPTPPGDGGCTSCWTPVPDNLADQKAMFASAGFSLTKVDYEDG